MLIYCRIGWKNSNCLRFEESLQYYIEAADYFLANPCYDIRETHDVIRSCADTYYYNYLQNHKREYLDKAYEYMQKATEYGEKMLECPSYSTALSVSLLKYQLLSASRSYFRLYLADEQYDKAEESLNLYLRAYEEAKGKDNGYSADMPGYFRCLAQLQQKKGNYEKAFEVRKQAYEWYQKYFSDANPRTVEILEELGRDCLVLKEEEEAKKYIALAAQNALVVFAKDHPILERILELKEKICA